MRVRWRSVVRIAFRVVAVPASVLVALLAIGSSNVAAQSQTLGAACSAVGITDAASCASLASSFSSGCTSAGGTITGSGTGTTCTGGSGSTATAAAAIGSSSPAQLGQAAQQSAQTVTQAGNNATRSAITGRRDQIQRRITGQGMGQTQNLGAMFLGSKDDPDSQMMGLTKGYQSAPSPLGVWVQGFYDRESRTGHDGFDDGRTTNTSGVIGGVDYQFNKVFSRNDVYLFGVLTGFTEGRVKADSLARTHVEGPSVGIYSVYVTGGLSVDFNSKIDFLSVDQSTSFSAFSADLKNYVTAANVNYKIYAAGGWVEPTIGTIYTVTKWDDGFGALDGHSVRVQGGLRFGQTLNWGRVVVEPTLTGLLYSDIVIDPSSPTNTPPTDEGRLFEQAIFKLNFDFGQGLSSSVEGEVRHGDVGSGSHVVGAAGRLGVRYQW